MADVKNNIKKLQPEDRAKLVKNLEQNLELLNLQAMVAESRARIKKANLEEIIYAVKIEELKNPPKPQTDGKS